MNKYPEIATERFDNAKLHIRYCLSFIKKYIKGNILEVGAGCGSFTKTYVSKKHDTISLTELDPKNIKNLNFQFSNDKKIKIFQKNINEIDGKFDSILYLHVLEHIEYDIAELKHAVNKLKIGGHIIIMVPAHQNIYSNLDKAVGHFRRYDKKFFKKDLLGLERVKLISLDAIGYCLYFLNKLFFKEEVFPSKIKIFIWDKFFTPLTILLDFFLGYKYGKCILAIYKKN
jgi:phospholipid N-methyltransferase